MSTRQEPVKKSKGDGASSHLVKAPATKRGNGARGRDVERMIAERAYYRAEQRGFAPGNEMTDWLQAEAEMRQVLGRGE